MKEAGLESLRIEAAETAKHLGRTGLQHELAIRYVKRLRYNMGGANPKYGIVLGWDVVRIPYERTQLGEVFETRFMVEDEGIALGEDGELYHTSPHHWGTIRKGFKRYPLHEGKILAGPEFVMSGRLFVLPQEEVGRGLSSLLSKS